MSQSAKTAAVSSRVGIMADNNLGGTYSYRASKAAVNAVFESITVNLKEKHVPVVLLYPGIVNTALDLRHGEGIGVSGAVEPAEAANGLWKVLKSKGLESGGMFFHRSVEELPW